jgi:hypothetical protein
LLYQAKGNKEAKYEENLDETELVVLVRGSDEERVLVACKGMGVTLPVLTLMECRYGDPCYLCSGISLS